MRANEGKMRPSLCVHCVEAWFQDERDENKGRIGLMCELDEWNPAIGCRKGQCYYYRREKKEEKEVKND